MDERSEATIQRLFGVIQVNAEVDRTVVERKETKGRSMDGLINDQYWNDRPRISCGTWLC